MGCKTVACSWNVGAAAAVRPLAVLFREWRTHQSKHLGESGRRWIWRVAQGSGVNIRLITQRITDGPLTWHCSPRLITSLQLREHKLTQVSLLLRLCITDCGSLCFHMNIRLLAFLVTLCMKVYCIIHYKCLYQTLWRHSSCSPFIRAYKGTCNALYNRPSQKFWPHFFFYKKTNANKGCGHVYNCMEKEILNIGQQTTFIFTTKQNLQNYYLNSQYYFLTGDLFLHGLHIKTPFVSSLT